MNEDKEVKKEVKKKFLFDIVNALKKGKNPTKISDEMNISKQKLNYYIHKLKDQGIIKKIGYGVWEVKKSTKDTIEKEVRGHAFIWKIKLPKIRNWEKRLEILEKLKIDYKLIGLKKTPRIILKNKKIWLGNKNIVIYDINSFIGKTSLEARKLAVYRLISILEELENKLSISLKINGTYEFKVSREHYALMKNNLAIQCNKDNEKIYVYDKGGLWFCVDNSFNLDEAETLGRNAMIDNLGIQGYFNSHKETNFKVTPRFILKGFKETREIMNGIQQNQLIFAENMKSHISAIKKLGNAVDILTKTFQKKNIKTKINENQSKLDKFL